jgi:arylsulfatase A-like enzyme
MDWFVTLAEIGGRRVPSGRDFDGIDIHPFFANPAPRSRKLFRALDSMSDLEYAIRSDAGTLMRDRDTTPGELYNLDEDPLEYFNRIETEDLIAQRLAAEAVTTMDSIQRDPLRPRTRMDDTE